jgi:hypothetical protein
MGCSIVTVPSADELIQVVGMSWDGRGTYQEWMRQKDDETAD